MKKKVVFISFGSNLGDRYATWEKTLALLTQVSGIRVIRAAQPIETDPVGPIQDQPRYLNSVIAIETTLDPFALLDQLLRIEQQLGRVRKERWGPRTVDLDILLYGDETVNDPRLRIPHPELKNRAFFLKLIEELNPPSPGVRREKVGMRAQPVSPHPCPLPPAAGEGKEVCHD